MTTQFEGFHSYPDAPEEVSFLRDRHRHIFHLKVWISIVHSEREIEFILFKRFIDSCISKTEFNNKSCETISDELWGMIHEKYPYREVRIEVSEDNENGSFKEYSQVFPEIS